MSLKNAFKSSLNGLKANKSRSALTILGIVIGIAAIILLTSLGKGAEELILNQIQGLGSKTIVVMPGREPKGPSDFAQIFSDSLKDQDLEILEKKINVPYSKNVVPLVFSGETGSFGGETYRLTLFGSSPEISQILDLVPREGYFFGSEDVKGRADTAVIGSKVKNELFHNADAINKKIKIKGRSFRVIGVLPEKGQVSFFNFDEAVIVPFTTAKQYIFGIKYFHRFIVEANEEKNIPETVSDIKTALKNSHGISDTGKDDFHIETQSDLANRLSSITNILTLFLVSVAAISLIVGGIGIMNIMLVSVTERTKEIGLRKAIGAKNKDILIQFLLESVILTIIGGFLGILIGAFFSFIVSLVLTKIVGVSWAFIFPVSAALLGLGVSSLVGLIFGIYPARKAASKSPIEALRYE